MRYFRTKRGRESIAGPIWVSICMYILSLYTSLCAFVHHTNPFHLSFCLSALLSTNAHAASRPCVPPHHNLLNQQSDKQMKKGTTLCIQT